MRLWRGRMHVQRCQLKRKENPMHPSKSESLAQDEEYLLPENEAALAATLALMTGFGHGCCDTHRPAMAARVAEQLENLACAGGLSHDMRALLGRLQQRWQAVADADAPLRSHRAVSDAGVALPAAHAAQPVPHALWHAPLDTLQ